MQKQAKTITFTRKLTESAIMLALSLVLAYFKLVDFPYGGGITLCSMLPVVIIAYRHGLGFGLLTGLANSLVQLLMGLDNLSYATSAGAAVAIIMLDYVLAYTAMGLGGVFRKRMKQTLALVCGMALVCVLRYVFHVIAGCTVWAGLSIPSAEALVYSLAYNGTYMLPETLVAVCGAAWISGAINFEGENLSRIASAESTKKGTVMRIIATLGAAVGFIADVAIVAPKLQNAETGDFDITGLANVNYTALGIVTVCAVVWFAVFYIISKKNKKA